MWRYLAAIVAAVTAPGVVSAAFTLTVISAPVGYTGPAVGISDGPSQDRINYHSDTSILAGEGVLGIATLNNQSPAFASIGTVVGINQGTEVPAGRYIIRIMRDDFTLPEGPGGVVVTEHTSIVPFFGTLTSPLVETTVTTQIVGGESATVNGSPMMTQMFERFTTRPPGSYTMIQTLVLDLPSGGSGGFGVNSSLTLLPAPSALFLAALGLPLLGVALRRRGPGVPGPQTHPPEGGG